MKFFLKPFVIIILSSLSLNAQTTNISTPSNIDIAKVLNMVKQGAVAQLVEAEKKGLDLNSLDAFGSSLLMNAILHQQTKVVDYLISKNVKLDVKSQNQQTALSLAVSNDQPELAKKLIELGVPLEGKCGRKELFVCAITMNDLNTAKLLFEKNKELILQKNEKNESVLIEAVKYGTTEVVKWLISQNKLELNDKSEDGKTALQIAQEMERDEIIVLLKK